MCIFSGARPVWVAGTNIFARFVTPGVQSLAYGMTVEAGDETAMVLPLPVAPGSGEDAVRFVALDQHPRMFEELAALFPEPLSRGGDLLGKPRSRAPLAVHAVGAFVASYVPSRADFARLDPRFRIPEVVFDAVPAYADYGFAVFQLAPGKRTIHPMGLTFPTRDPARLFFPTVHVHDGVLHDTARFDHALYLQDRRCTELDSTFRGARTSVSYTSNYAGIAESGKPVVRRELRGVFDNGDVWIDAE